MALDAARRLPAACPAFTGHHTLAACGRRTLGSGEGRGRCSVSAAVQKSKREAVVVRMREYQGRRFVDVRLNFWREDGELQPTKQGFTVSLDKAGDLARAIEAAAAQADPDA